MLFASVDLPSLDKDKATTDIMSLDESLWFWDSYRATSMLPLMTKGASIGAQGANNRNRQGEFEWVPYAPPSITSWFDDVVFPWMGMKSRVMALKTLPRAANHEHIDCDAHKMDTRQHKFRIVIHGRVETLYFMTKQGNVHAPDIDGPFIMDGSWPHGMDNATDDFKLTLAVGAPWDGRDHYDNINLLLQQKDYQMPDDFAKNFMKV